MSKSMTIIQLADELGVDPGDVAVYVDQLIDIEGEESVIVGPAPQERTISVRGAGERINELLTHETVLAIHEQYRAMRSNS